MYLLVSSPERGCVPWSVLFSDIYVATDPAFQEAGIQQLLWEGSGSIVIVCLRRQKRNTFKPGSEKLSGKQEKWARATWNHGWVWVNWVSYFFHKASPWQYTSIISHFENICWKEIYIWRIMAWHFKSKWINWVLSRWHLQCPQPEHVYPGSRVKFIHNLNFVFCKIKEQC